MLRVSRFSCFAMLFASFTLDAENPIRLRVVFGGSGVTRAHLGIVHACAQIKTLYVLTISTSHISITTRAKHDADDSVGGEQLSTCCSTTWATDAESSCFSTFTNTLHAYALGKVLYR